MATTAVSRSSTDTEFNQIKYREKTNNEREVGNGFVYEWKLKQSTEMFNLRASSILQYNST